VKREKKLPLVPLLAALTAILLAVAALPASPTRALLFVAVAGLPPLLSVRRSWHLLELCAAPPAAALVLFALAGALLGPRSPLLPFLPGLLAAALAANATRERPRVTVQLGIADAAAGLAAGLWLWPLMRVFRRNGLHRAVYLARTWFNHDSFYLFSLAEESIQRNGFPADNPFIAGVANYYPSLLHVGLGSLSAQSGAPAAIGVLPLVQLLLATSPVLCLFAVWRCAGKPSRLGGAALLLGLAAAIALRPDLFLYPHTQSLAMTWLFLLLWLWADAPELRERLAAFVVATALVLAHTVTGATGVAVLLGRSVAELPARETRRIAVASVLVGLLQLVLFLVVNRLPFPSARVPWDEASFGGIGEFLAGWWLPIVGVFALLAGNFRRPLSTLSALGVLALGALYYAHGSMLVDPGERWFVFFNAERFLHLGLIIALPLAATCARPVAPLAMLLVLGSALFRPTKLAQDTQGLLSASPLLLDAHDLSWFERIRRETPPDARIISNLFSYALPAFTGRSQNPIEGNFWGNDTLPTDEFAARLNDWRSFLLHPVGQLAVLERWGYTHVMIRRAETRGEVRAWTAQLATVDFRLVAEDDRYLLFALTSSPSSQ